MWKDLGASWAILLGIGFMMLANGLQGTLLGVRAGIEGFSTFNTGIMMSGYFIGLFIGSMIAPILVNRVGHIRVFSALASLASISILFHGVYIDPWIWMAMRVVTGISFAGFYVVTESWLNDRASNETRGKVLSVYMVIVTGSMGAGQFALNLAHPAKIDLFILISAVISLGLIPILLTVKPAPNFSTSSKMSVVELYRASPLAVI
ncbi:MAG: MFS transporter, partial [Gammaproteobacteria bacterium]|nr:MFS transporter [Gammaproteobacteria bacterium]